MRALLLLCLALTGCASAPPPPAHYDPPAVAIITTTPNKPPPLPTREPTPIPTPEPVVAWPEGIDCDFEKKTVAEMREQLEAMKVERKEWVEKHCKPIQSSIVTKLDDGTEIRRRPNSPKFDCDGQIVDLPVFQEEVVLKSRLGIHYHRLWKCEGK